LRNVCGNFHLYVFAFDDNCYKKLVSLNLPKLSVISLQDFETKELLGVKPTRNRVEYCWTCGPSTVWHAIHYFQLDHCIYVDADLLFFHSPAIAYDEIEKAKASVAITKHFTKKEDPAGHFCVQFLYFRNDANGMDALKWWRDSCIDWCFARYENGKYGDQKYLDLFPSKFNNVHIFKHRGIGVAPWNMYQYHYLKNHEFIYKETIYPIVFFHYHGLRVNIEKNNLLLKTITYDTSKIIRDMIFMPFLTSYKDVLETYFDIKVENLIIVDRRCHKRLYSFIKRILKRSNAIRFLFNVFNEKRYNGYEEKNIFDHIE
jgi:hypothetical protein